MLSLEIIEMPGCLELLIRHQGQPPCWKLYERWEKKLKTDGGLEEASCFVHGEQKNMHCWDRLNGLRYRPIPAEFLNHHGYAPPPVTHFAPHASMKALD